MDRLESMAVLVEAAKSGSLSAAGRKLGMPLASVSRKVAELEAFLGTPILIRSNRRLSLSEAGRDYVLACARILEEIGEAERVVAGEYAVPKGDLVLTAPIVFGRLHLLPVVTDFLSVFPEINIRLQLTDRVVSMTEDQVDLAFRIGSLPDSSLVAVKVGAIRQCIVASPDYCARRGQPLRPSDLAEHDIVAFDGLAGTAHWRFHSGKDVLEIPIRPRLIVNTAEAAIDAAMSGAGITRILSYQARQAIDHNRLVRLLDSYGPPSSPVSLVHAGHRQLPRKLRAFVDFATPRLRAVLAGQA